MSEHPRRGNVDESAVARARNPLGKSLIEKIQDLLDSSLYESENCDIADSPSESPTYQHHLGKTEGIAAALGILRSTSLDVEMDLSAERLGLR